MRPAHWACSLNTRDEGKKVLTKSAGLGSVAPVPAASITVAAAALAPAAAAMSVTAVAGAEADRNDVAKMPPTRFLAAFAAGMAQLRATVVQGVLAGAEDAKDESAYHGSWVQGNDSAFL